MRVFRKRVACCAAAVALAAALPRCQAQENATQRWTACVEATCRVTAADGGRGTGCAFERSQGYVFLLTGAHVATSAALECEFWRAGHQSRPLAGRVVLRDETADVAVVAIAQRALGESAPPVVPLAPPDWVAAPGDTLGSVGCARGAWATGWQGHAIGYDAADLHFLPAPANGRSGSALFDATGRFIVGLIRARSGDDSRGIAVSVQTIYRALGNASQRNAASRTALPPVTLTQCIGGLCPPRGSLLPFGNRQPDSGQADGPVYPTLPLARRGASDNGAHWSAAEVDWSQLAEAMAGSAQAQRDAAEAQLAAARAQSDYFRRQQQLAEAEEHKQLLHAAPGSAGEAISQAAAGQFSQAFDTATDGPMLGWLGQVIVYGLLALTGLTGVPALLIRFGVPLALRAVGKRLKSGLHTEADVVVNEIAARTVRSMNGAVKR